MNDRQAAEEAGDAAPGDAVVPGGAPGAAVRLLALAEVLLCSSVPTQLAVVAIIAAVGIETPADGGALSLAFVVALGLGDSVLLVALMVVITRAHGQRLRDLWLGHRPPGREALVGLMLVPAIFLWVVVLMTGLRLLAPWIRTVPENPLEALATTGTAAAIAMVVVAIVAGGVREELQRAFLLVRFERHLGGAGVGIVVVSVVFGVMHDIQGADAMIATGTLGALWAVLYVRRRSVIAPMVSHAGFNALQILQIATLAG